MNPLFKHERLLEDVLAEDAPGAFRSALLGETLRLARRRRRTRRVRYTALAVAGIGLFCFLVRQGPGLRQPVRPTAYELVRTQPWSQAGIVRTQPLARERVITSIAGDVAVVHTDQDHRGIRIIGDSELLTLAAAKGAILVRIGPNEQKLLFTSPAGKTTPENPGAM